MSVPQWRGVARLVIGLAFVGIGVFRQLNLDPGSYPTGDWRADPILLGALNIGVVVAGLIFVASGLNSIRPPRPRDS